MALCNTWNRARGTRAAPSGSRRPSRGGRPTYRPCPEVLEDRYLLSSYTVTDLGTLGGPTSSAAAINGAGEVVGYADTTNYYVDTSYGGGKKPTRIYVLQEDPFLWKPSAPNGTRGSLTDLGNFGGWDSSASGINGTGQVVGISYLITNGYHAFLWAPSTPNGTGGSMLDLGTLGGTNSMAHGINRGGQVVGRSDTGSGSQRAFLWTPRTPNGTTGTMIDLNTQAGPNSLVLEEATGINDSGQVAGSGEGESPTAASAALLYSGGKVIDLGSLGGTGIQDDSQAAGINNWGQVIGDSYTGPATHAFLWSPSTANGTTGSMIDLGSLVGTSGSSQAYGINTAGQVVGASDAGTGNQHAFLWTPTTANGTAGTMTDLNTLTGSSTILLERAAGINDQGQIVGFGILRNNGSPHAFLLTPTGTAPALAPPASGAATTGTSGSATAGSGGPSLAPLPASPPPGAGSLDPAVVPFILDNAPLAGVAGPIPPSSALPRPAP